MSTPPSPLPPSPELPSESPSTQNRHVDDSMPALTPPLQVAPPASAVGSKQKKPKKTRNKSIDITPRSTDQLDPNDNKTSASSTQHRWFNRSPASSSSSSLVLPDQSSSQSTLSPTPLANSNDTLPLPTQSSKSKNRSTRSKSIGSLNLLTSALSRTSSTSSSSSSTTAAAANRPITPPFPTQNTSLIPDPSSSTTERVPLEQTRKSSSSSTSSNSSSLLQVAASSLHRNRKKKKSPTLRKKGSKEGRGENVEEEWSNAEIEEGDEQGRIISEEMIRAKSNGSNKSKSSGIESSGGTSPVLGGGSQTGGGKFVKNLRRTRSKLGLIGNGSKGKEVEENVVTRSTERRTEQAEEEEDGTMIQSPVLTFIEPPSPSEARSFSQDLDQPPQQIMNLSTNQQSPPRIISTSPTVNSFFSSPPSDSGSPPSPPPAPSTGISKSTTTQRIGGWFTSILNNSTSSSTSSGSEFRSSPNSSPEKPRTEQPRQRTHSSHSPSSARTFFSSPTKKQSMSSLSLPPSSSSSSSTSSTPVAAAGLPTSTSRLGPLDRMLDKAVQYFLDTDSNVDKCSEDIWLLGGVRHDGWRPSPTSADDLVEGSERASLNEGGGGGMKSKRWSPMKTRAAKRERQNSQRDTTSIDGNSLNGSPTPSLRSFSTTVSGESSSMSFHSPISSSEVTPTTTTNTMATTTDGWPISFYRDFYSRPALTYRSNFVPIPCSPSNSRTGGTGGATGAMHGMFNSLSLSIGRGGSAGRGGGEENGGLTSDTGWGCMLRTGQSLLANALVTAHLGRDWRRPLPPTALPLASPHGQPAASLPISSALPPSYSTYTRILSLFLDTPSSSSPFSIHKFALEGQRLGKSVGEWFGPSTAAGAIKKLVNDFEPAGMRVVSCIDGTVYDNEVVAAGTREEKWDTKVLVLINLRLGIDGVNPIYHEAIKAIFRIPQSVGIAGGRPSSSYYFVGSQANSLFYIDPHHPRPAISTIDLPSELQAANSRLPLDATLAQGNELDEDRVMLDSFFSTAYDDSAWRTYHCDKVRKCSLSSLDPSMLVGFLIQNEEDWEDFKIKARELGQSSSAIFSIAPSPPKWMRRSSSTALPPPAQTISASPGDESFSEIDEDSIVQRPAASPEEGGVATEAFEEDDVDFSEPEGWELDSTDASDDNESPRQERRSTPSPRPRERTASIKSDEDEESDPVFVDSRTSLRSRESTRGAQ